MHMKHSLILDCIPSFISSQFHIVHNNDFAPDLCKCSNSLLPDWDKLFKFHDRVNVDDLSNGLLITDIENEKHAPTMNDIVRFDKETFIQLSSHSIFDTLLPINFPSHRHRSSNNSNISVYLTKESNEMHNST